MGDNWLSMSRLCRLDVKWAGQHQGNSLYNDQEHSNPFFEIIMVTDGTIYMQVEDEKLELSSGDILLLKPWEVHKGWKANNQKDGFFWVQFYADPPLQELDTGTNKIDELKIIHLHNQDLRTSEEPVNDFLLLPRHYHPTKRYEMLNLFEQLLHSVNHPKGYFRYRNTILLGQLLELLAIDILERSDADQTVPSSFTTYLKLVLILNEVYMTEISKDVIEKKTSKNYEYLCQVFKKYTGITIVTYIHQLRMQRAKHLLFQTRRTIQDIAAEVGFQDPFYFSRLFKRMEQISPQAYRKKSKG